MLKDEVHSLVPRRCVDFGLAKAQMTPSLQRRSGRIRLLGYVSVHCLTAIGNAVSVVSYSRYQGSRVSIGKERKRLQLVFIINQLRFE